MLVPSCRMRIGDGVTVGCIRHLVLIVSARARPAAGMSRDVRECRGIRVGRKA